jgi:hypothetical protein
MRQIGQFDKMQQNNEWKVVKKQNYSVCNYCTERRKKLFKKTIKMM